MTRIMSSKKGISRSTVVMFAFLLAACGTASTDTTTTSTTAPETTTTQQAGEETTTTTEPPAETYEIRVASASSSLTAGLVLSALSLDTFADNGIELEYTDFRGSSSNPIAALIGGEAEVALVGTATGLNAMAQGVPLVIVAALAGNTSEMAIATAVLNELDVTADSTVEERMEALRGRVIATAAEGSSNAQMLRSLLAIYGLDPASDVTVLPSDPTAIISGLREGLYDAAFYGSGVMQNNYADGTAVPWIVLPRGDVPNLDGMVFATMVTTRDILEQQPGMVAAFVKSLADAGSAIEADSDAVSAAVKAEWFPDMNPEVYELSWEGVNAAWPRDAKMSEADWEFTVAFSDEGSEADLSVLDFTTYVAEMARR